MSHTLEIDTEAFERLGAEVVFDCELYDELLNTLCPDHSLQQPPNVRLHPNTSWKLSVATTPAEGFAAFRTSHTMNGKYYPRTRNLDVFVEREPTTSNQTLIHESRHWADVMTGLYEQYNAQMLRRGIGYGALSLSVSVAAGVETAQHTNALTGGVVGAAVLWGTTLASMIHVLRNNEYERRGDSAEHDPELNRRFGGIITVNLFQD